MSVTITVNPESALIDDPWRVLVTGLSPWQPVTLAATLVEDGHVFVSHAFYVSNGNGSLDLETSASHGGTYQGIEPMGLLWSMQPAPGQMKGLRLIKRDVSQPMVVNVHAVSGHCHVVCEENVQDSLASVSVKRYYQARDVTSYDVRVGNVRGKLFLPPGDGPFPGVLDMFGTAGGLITFRAALLASRGFCAFALPYFGYDDLPAGIELNLEYFEEAVDWLHLHPCVMKSGLGILGVSKGATLALHIATVSSKIRAVVEINGPILQTPGLHYYKGILQPVFNADYLQFVETEEGYVIGGAYSPALDVTGDSCVPVEKVENYCKLLLIESVDDPSQCGEHVDAIVARLDQNNKNNYRVLRYPGAGHLLEPPYMPLCRSAYSKIVGCPLLYGGETRSHALAQDDAWQQTLTFLWKELNPGRINERRRVRPHSMSFTCCSKSMSKL